MHNTLKIRNVIINVAVIKYSFHNWFCVQIRNLTYTCNEEQKTTMASGMTNGTSYVQTPDLFNVLPHRLSSTN
jgi:hypothetical protein